MPEPARLSLDYWRQHTHLLREGLLQRVDELSVSDYPAATPKQGATPYQVIRFIQDFLAHISLTIDKATSEDRLRMLSALIRQLGVFLDWLDNAHTEQTPRGLAQLLKDLIDKMVPGSRVVARPQAQYNYSIYDLGKTLAMLVSDFIPQSKQIKFSEHLSAPIKLISFPRIERDNMLAHAIFGHELGHPVAEEFLANETKDHEHIATHPRIQKEVNDLVKQNVAGLNADESQILALTTQTFDRILQVRERALKELISDAVGIIIFGPCAFFACYELFWTSSWDARPTHDSWYPPSRMRVRRMLALMDDLNLLDFSRIGGDPRISAYLDPMQGFIDDARRLSAATDDQRGIESDPLLKIAYNWMGESLTKAIEHAKAKTTAVAFQPGKILEQLPELIQRLEIGVPPNEIGDPANPTTVDYRASLLAAWLFKLRGINPESGKALTCEDIDRLRKKTLSAIEYVILQDEYARHVHQA